MNAKPKRTNRAAGTAIGNINGGTVFLGNVQADHVTVGNDTHINYAPDQINIDSADDYLAALKNIKESIVVQSNQLGHSYADKNTLLAVERSILKAIEEAKEEKPKGTEIKKILDQAKDNINSISNISAAAVQLGIMLGKLAAMANTLFGS